MKLKNKCIIFGLTDTYYAFRKTIDEMKNLVLEGANIFPIMSLDSSKSKYDKVIDFMNEIEAVTGRKIITDTEEAEKRRGDIMIIAPCSRYKHCETCKINI